jgi:carbon-monoxide dehydrogenase large subunit
MMATNRREGVGARVLRKEDARFLTGRGRYADDMRVEGAGHAAFVRSPYPHAKIRAIRFDQLEGAPGFIAAFHGEDLGAAGVKPIGIEFTPVGVDGKEIMVPSRWPLARERVRYVGEPVAVVLAETLRLAQDFAEQVVVDYEELPAVIDAAAAVTHGATVLWDAAARNVAVEMQYGNREAADHAFASAVHVVTLDLINNRLTVNPIEPRVAIATIDPASDRYTLYATHQNPFQLRTQLSEILNLSEKRLRVISEDMGGGFGVKGPMYPEEAVVLWACHRLGRAVRWTCLRSEAFLSDAHARDHVTHIEMACDADGRFLAIRVRDIANLGAYVSTFGAGPPIVAQAVLACGPYRIGAVDGRVRMVFTNTVPTDAYRGAGRPENTFMIERLVDCVACDLGIEPAELRRRNLITPEQIPYRTPLGRVYDSGDFPRNLALALEAIDYASFAARAEAVRSRGRLSGIGLSCFIEHSGMGPSGLLMSRGVRFGSYESAHVRLEPGGGAIVYTGTHSHGQGLETALAQLVAERLGIPIADIDVRHGDTSQLAYGRGTVGSRSLLAGGAAIAVALDKIETKARRIAAHLIECAESDLTFADGRFTVSGTDRAVSLAEVTRAAYFPLRYPLQELEPGLEEIAYWDPISVASPNGCHACEVEIDPETGSLAITRFIAVHDFGSIVNPIIVAGQVHGGVAQGIGQAKLEACHYDITSGQLFTGSFTDYAMPRAHDLPPIEALDNPHPTPSNPLGVKGCGEAGAIGSPPAVVNAAVAALAGFGVRHLDMPLTSESIWRALGRHR